MTVIVLLRIIDIGIITVLLRMIIIRITIIMIFDYDSYCSSAHY